MVWEPRTLNVAVFQRWMCPFLLSTRFQLVDSLWFLSDSPLHEAAYIFSWRQMWSVVWSHAAGTRAGCGLASSCWNNHGPLGERGYLDCSLCLSKILISTSASKVPSHVLSHPCYGHWCSPIPSQMLAFTPFSDNSLDDLCHLWHVEADVSFPKKQLKHGLIWPQNTCPLSFCPSDVHRTRLSFCTELMHGFLLV